MAEGLVTVRSARSVHDTVARVQGALEAKGIKLFDVIDHSGEAEKAGMQLRDTKLLIFGSPKAGTPLMQAAPSIAIDLPLKVLVWEDDAGAVWLTYNTPEHLIARHHVKPELAGPLNALRDLVEAVAR